MARPATLIKKYSNRRLYDTGESRYITLEELSAKIQAGEDVRVVDAKTNEDLTQATLTQVIIEGRGAGKLLPVPLLAQLIRLGDDSLAEFFGRWVTGALEVYLQAKRGANAVSAYNPFATMPFNAGDALARMWMNNPFMPQRSAPMPQPPMDDPPAEEAASADDLADLRRELEELKRSMQPPRKKRR
ncbi:MAG TPA: polyhydroxyalkanoate synthesis regulator DNA-binding domain-containing protein [Kofleriaceae bacterium]|nr:polyhydroxyalkanoate synthesis regulator DNA-binding domain-containing protein [Kofleriaceae bacterium]